jgi:FkbM family methyltransferase
MQSLRVFPNWILSRFGLRIVKLKNLEMLYNLRPVFEKERQGNYKDPSGSDEPPIFSDKYPLLSDKFLAAWPKAEIRELLALAPFSKSQLGQDLMAISHLKYKRQGYFVEFGASDGMHFSNSYMLEKNFGWKGIVAEPARVWQRNLVENRSCNIDFRCVWREDNELLQFCEAEIAVLSTLKVFQDKDLHRDSRINNHTYDVQTISLNSLLTEHEAPRMIDYLSIDTEGSELEILKAFDFTMHEFGFISIEHNHTPDKQEIQDLLTSKGYSIVAAEISDFDMWFIKD